MSDSPRIVFAGTPEFAVPALRRLAASGLGPALVLTQPDRRAGRGRRLTPSPVKRAALELGIEVRQPERVAEASELEALGPAPDLLVVVAFGQLLPRRVLDWPLVAPVNVHASLLPRWRGAAPIAYAVLSDDTETGVSIMRIVPKLDAGPVYATRATPIGAAETAGELHERLAVLGAELLAQTLPRILSGEALTVPQDETRATYAPKLAKADAVLDWSAPAVELERRVRGFDPWPVAETTLPDGARLRVWRAVVVEASGRRAAPGTVVATGSAGIDVATGAGVLRLTSIQPPSGRRMDASAWLAAHDVRGLALGR